MALKGKKTFLNIYNLCIFNVRSGCTYLALMKLSLISPIMYSQGPSSFANNAVSVAADIIRESSFMQQLSDIKEWDVGIKIIYCLDDPSTVNHFT